MSSETFYPAATNHTVGPKVYEQFRPGSRVTKPKYLAFQKADHRVEPCGVASEFTRNLLDNI